MGRVKEITTTSENRRFNLFQAYDGYRTFVTRAALNRPGYKSVGEDKLKFMRRQMRNAAQKYNRIYAPNGKSDLRIIKK